jgi:hypothetical protein
MMKRISRILTREKETYRSRCRWLILFCCAALFSGCQPDLATIKRHCVAVDRLPNITPDYAGITIPPNIAPLNFSLRDSSAACVAEISSVNGPAVAVRGEKGAISIREAAWKRLLSENVGKLLRITVYSRDCRGAWRHYAPIENAIAAEPIDRYCTYRLLTFQYSYWSDLRECQRDLTSFNETAFLNTENCAQNYSPNNSLRCVNCHTPLNGDPSRFVLQLRSAAYGCETLIADADTVTTLLSRLGHAAWHPSGRFIAFSVYKVQQYFHAVGRQFIDVYDNNSGIVIYDVAARKIVPVPRLNKPGVLETWPAWSPDGGSLYFCSAPVPWSDYNKEPPDNFNKTKYSLLRIPYDIAHNKWGTVDTVLSTAQTGLSIALPRLSPDGKFCLFCMQPYGAYPYTQPGSDLYLMDVATKKYRKPPINSDYHESWHSWSKNSRWILFSSKRGAGMLTRLYISYIDSAGNARKPFILPQADPTFYDSFIKCYNVPELAIAPVRFSERQLLKAIQAQHTVTVAIPANGAVRSADTSANGPWSVGGRE